MTHNKEYTITPIVWGDEVNAGFLPSTVVTRLLC